MLREILKWFAIPIVSFWLAFSAQAGDIKVTLLGTGSPPPYSERSGPSTLVEAGSEKLLFDVGRGSATRLFQSGIAPDSISAHFFTHLHSDHTVGLPDLWLTGWFGRPWPPRTSPLVIFGPTGTRAMTEYLTKAFAEDIRIRLADQKLPAAGVQFITKDFSAPGVIYEKNGVKVTAIEVNHGGEIKPAYGFAVEYGGKKIVLSGDTTYDKRIIEAATNADLLVHSVAIIEPELLKIRPILNETLERFASPEQAGRVFSAAKPKLAVYSHIVFYTVQPTSILPTAALTERTKTTYSGPFLVGQDLMSFAIGDDAIRAFGADGRALESFSR